MLKPLFAFALTASLLAGCQNAAPTVAPAPAAQATYQDRPLKAPRLVATSQVRRVLQAEGLTIFGINFSLSYRTYRVSRSKPWVKEWTPGKTFAGRGELITASYNRYVYQVPDDQMLILNQSGGKGSIALNGYAFDVTQGHISYLFGPGELVVFTFNPQQTYAYSNDSSTQISYAGLGISGYVGSPELIGRVMGGKTK